jgi:hypothetical protein
MEDFVYACIQLTHNLGAVAVVGSPAVGLWLMNSSPLIVQPSERKSTNTSIYHSLAWLTFFAWSTQIGSGAAFGVTTYFLKHEVPQLTGIGLSALLIKVTCAFICVALTVFYLRTGTNWSERLQIKVWQALFFTGLTALISAAFLRWYG